MPIGHYRLDSFWLEVSDDSTTQRTTCSTTDLRTGNLTLCLKEMCGRTALGLEPQEILNRTGTTTWRGQDRYRKSWNGRKPRTSEYVLLILIESACLVAPARSQPVIRQDKETGEKFLQSMRWGLIPHWTSAAPDYPSTLRTINARDDRIISPTKSMWHAQKHTKRCVAVAEAFYEWHKKPGKDKQPYLIRWKEEGRLLMFAALWDRVELKDMSSWEKQKKPGNAVKQEEGQDQDGQENPVPENKNEVYSFSVVTTHASDDFAFLHDRMPVILRSQEEVDMWLDPTRRFDETLEKLLCPVMEGLEWFPVSTFVSKVGNDSLECIKPIKLLSEADGKNKLLGMFQKQEKKEKLAGAANVKEELKPALTDDTRDTSKADVKKQQQEEDKMRQQEDEPICGVKRERSEETSDADASSPKRVKDDPDARSHVDKEMDADMDPDLERALRISKQEADRAMAGQARIVSETTNSGDVEAGSSSSANESLAMNDTDAQYEEDLEAVMELSKLDAGVKHEGTSHGKPQPKPEPKSPAKSAGKKSPASTPTKRRPPTTQKPKKNTPITSFFKPQNPK
ncbi:hypothetical protein DFS34DRAFT_648877 [Phlyctochytrium arcticum]|nr:hypothetical protein DFS34DRAFT_648877 [Phlyctochytrium arcticum]